MKHCEFCKANFANEDAYQIHLGVGAPTFHPCNKPAEMKAKGMTQDQDGTWSIDESLIIRAHNWAYLKSASKLERFNTMSTPEESKKISTPQSSIWHTEKKTETITEYYCVIVDGEKSISFILTEDTSSKSVTASPYNPGDFNYTVHDSCDHEDDYCVLEDPNTSEFQEAAEYDRIRYEIDKLRALEQQIKQARQADELRSKKKELTQAMQESEG